MSVITGLNLCKAYAQDILRDANFALEAGDHIGLIGRNGEGKTTLLRILAGLEEPTSGQLQKRRGLRVGYLPQDPPAPGDKTLWQAMLAVFDDVHKLQDDMEHLAKELSGPNASQEILDKFGDLQHEFESRGGYDYEVKIKTVLGGLGFNEHSLSQPMAHLSGGQRTRALLGSLLLEEPDVLLLDEPTNHLDLEAVEWLEQWLDNFAGSLVIVSHDRYFLDRTVKKVWEISFTRLLEFAGNYSNYLIQRDIQKATQERAWQNQQARIKKDEEFIRRNFAAQKHKQAHSRQKAIDRLLETEGVEKPRDHKDMNLRFEPALRSGDQVFKTRDLVVGYTPDKPLLRMEGEQRVMRGTRVALVGGNGVGKTTLVKTLLGQIPPLHGLAQQGASIVFGYLPQTHDNLNGELTVLQMLRKFDDTLTTEKVRTVLGAFLFSSEDVFKRVSQLSGGERSRLVLATLAVQGANVLLLDEPTNHLDIASQEVLQEVLTDFEGTVLFVSHDRYLIDKLATEIWVVEGRDICTMTGNWQEYLHWRRKRLAGQSGKAAVQPARAEKSQPKQREGGKHRPELAKIDAKKAQPVKDKPAAAPAARRGDTRNRESYQHKRQRQKTERQLEALEKEIAALEAQLKLDSEAISHASLAQDMDKVRQLAVEYQKGDAKLKDLWYQWAGLSESLDRPAPESNGG